MALVLLLMAGCALNTFKARTGSGDPQAPRAIVAPEKNVAISDIDGKTVFVTARNWWVPVVTNTRASLMPGEHTLTIKYAVTGWTSVGCQLTFEAQSGKRYTIHGKKLDFDNATGFAAVKQPQIISVVVWVTDTDNGEVIVDETASAPVSS
jgi:hypothetical protein